MKPVMVSISDEKPLHMRPRYGWFEADDSWCFNLRREAAPHATALEKDPTNGHQKFQSQTRSRSTCDDTQIVHDAPSLLFQSQTRSRSTCDIAQTPFVVPAVYVSISDEKPLHMRHVTEVSNEALRNRFNLRREAAPHATCKAPVRNGVLWMFQ